MLGPPPEYTPFPSWEVRLQHGDTEVVVTAYRAEPPERVVAAAAELIERMRPT